MYYSSNKNNSDYYNAYKQEMANLEDYQEEFSFQKMIKIALTILTVGLISIFIIYLANTFSTEKKDLTMNTNSKPISIENSPRMALSEQRLPKSIQLQDSNLEKIKKVQAHRVATQTLSNIEVAQERTKPIEKFASVSPKDIALLVEIIAAQMSSKQDVSLEKQLIEAEEKKIHTKTLKEINHYNKVVVSHLKKNNTQEKDPQTKLIEKLNIALSIHNETLSVYEKSIKEEIYVRSNEMRIIIVQKGDTLSKIAKKAYGDIDAYPKIFMANPEVLKNPNEIFAGQRLRIPA